MSKEPGTSSETQVPPPPDPYDFLHQLRKYELLSTLDRLSLNLADKTLLEIGSGTGYQLRLLAERCKEVVGVEVPGSSYPPDPRLPILKYDGKRLPFADQTFDIIFSSNTLEHVRELSELHREMRRALKDDGIALHLLPSPSWRIWTSLAHYFALPSLLWKRVSKRVAGSPSLAPQLVSRSFFWLVMAGLVAPRHGERGNRFSEAFYFSPRWWTKNFTAGGWEVMEVFPVGLFYTGYTLLGQRLSLPTRAKLARFLGSSCYGYLLRKKTEERNSPVGSGAESS